VGVIVLVNGKKYCVPLSSPKPKFESKKNAVDFMRIIDDKNVDSAGNGRIIGALNFNNMLPVDDSLIKPIDMKIRTGDNGKEKAYKNLLAKQLDWCRKNEEKLISHANRTYELVVNYPDKSKNLTRRSCDFKKLESVLEKYLRTQINSMKSLKHSL